VTLDDSSRIPAVVVQKVDCSLKRVQRPLPGKGKPLNTNPGKRAFSRSLNELPVDSAAKSTENLEVRYSILKKPEVFV
jgi:hypothetical protein